jgi:hypothetical protein
MSVRCVLLLKGEIMSDEVRGIEEFIKEALAKGEFDDRPGKGQPLDLNAYFPNTRTLRMSFAVL